MEEDSADTKLHEVFPPSPVSARELLVPIASWPEMHQESKSTKVEFDLFWYDSVRDGVAYFFRWLGEPRCTVLVVWDDDGPTHIECRTIGDRLVAEQNCLPIIAEITQAFRDAGFWQGAQSH